ncbi:YciI family protein [uncultured Maribacter sp.]|uniref:YciI family protein n=1 Tax=uncultured Maribacter sp. TaxID=431308 RepID=UPI0026357C8F|nr:YciI family protein [uncultured Maribacter sp.]
MKVEKKFMMLFRYTPNPDYKPTLQEMEQMRQDWGGFIGNIAMKEKLDSTYQLGFEGKQIAANSSVLDGILISDNKTISGNMIVNANSLEEAVEMAKDSPILKMGGSVEVRNIIPMDN